jgi:signal transduction histidine kinase
MSQSRVWIYAVILFLLVGTILATQVSWLLQSARIEESFLSQRVNMALCSAMDVLSNDRGLCSNVESCVSHGQGTFEISFNAHEKEKIDSVIQHHLRFYNIHAPFKTTLSPYTTGGSNRPLPSDQALLFPAKAGMKNVLVHIEIPSKPQLIRAQINGTFILSGIVLVLLIGVFINTLRGLIRERKIRTETVDFINTMAHDLKTPISNIAFAASILTRDQQQNTLFQNQYISIIDEEIKKLKERSRRILGAASVDAVLEDAIDETEIDIHEIIEQSIDSFSLRLATMNGEITKQLQASRSIVKGSKLQLSSAIANIIDNAITYSKSSFSMRVRTKNDRDGISIEIQDNGPGIPANEQELVFKKAYRIRNGKTLPEGFGLGLYLSKTLVEKHGGKLSLSSDGLTGSCFIVQLPLS